MTIHLPRIQSIRPATLHITGSKSETNRLLLLQALFPDLRLTNVSASDDAMAMQSALATMSETIDVHHAGTAMRFLTAYFATRENRCILLTGSQRMKERPIAILVDALRELGAQIEYEATEGFPPLRITGRKLSGGKITLEANVSSQYISALLLIAPALEHGIELSLTGEITSRPYINMTLPLLNQAGIVTDFSNGRIVVKPGAASATQIAVESDWSSASYFYSIIALSQIGSSISLATFKESSFQGDSALAVLYKDFGVKSTFENNLVTISKVSEPKKDILFNLNNTPDIAQTIAVTAFGLGLKCDLSGLHTLKIKETDRLEALQTELRKLGAGISVTNESLHLEPSTSIRDNIGIDTYNDHRMAMAFAPLALKTNITIHDAEVVSKSYPTFWDDLNTIGFKTQQN